MKLKTYNRSNTLTGVKTSLPCISFSVKTGKIKLSAKLVQGTDFKDGDQIAVSQDEDNKVYWYLHKGDEYGFPLSERGHSSSQFKALEFCSKDLCRKLLEETDLHSFKGTVVMVVNKEPKVESGLTLYEIVTRTARKSKQDQ